jgi:hypothetical protein
MFELVDLALTYRAGDVIKFSYERSGVVSESSTYTFVPADFSIVE